MASSKRSGLDLSGGAVDITDPKNQVPEPSIPQTLGELEDELSAQEDILEDLRRNPYGRTRYPYASRTAYENAKQVTLKLVNETIPAKIQERQKWENDWGIRGYGKGAGIVISATEVYDLQQQHRQMQTESPAVKRYSSLVAKARELEKKLGKTKTKPLYEQELEVAQAWRAAFEAMTPEVERARVSDLPTVITREGRIVERTNFLTRDNIAKYVDSYVDSAVKKVEKETATYQVTATDKYGQPTERILVRSPENIKKLDTFLNKANNVTVSGNFQTSPVEEEPATPTTSAPSPTLTPADAPNARVAQAMARQQATDRPMKSEPKVINGQAVIVDTLPNGTVVTRPDTSTPSPSGVSTTGTSGGGANVGATVGAGTGMRRKAAGISSTAWESKFREIAPSKAWLLDLDRSKYPGLFAFLQKSVTENYDDERFATELEGTDYYRELALSGKAREIKSIVGDLGFDSTDFSKFLTDAVNQGWEGDRLKQKTYEEVFRRNPDGAFANPTALARARKSNDYLNVQLIATNYFNKPSESSIEAVLTGRIMTEDFQRQQREIAKAKYAHLAPLIDQGVTLDDLATNFKQSAARLLELDPAAIDMSAAEYEVALNFGEEGKRRVMTTGEWERLLRTDQRYGWEKTENAKNEARSLATNIAQAFGRII